MIIENTIIVVKNIIFYNIFINNTIISNKYGILANTVTGNVFINSTIAESMVFDIHIKELTDLFLLNSSFNKSSVEFIQSTSSLTVQWYTHVNIFDYLGNPVPNAYVKIKDNMNGSYNQIFVTDSNGFVRWIPITEYIEQDISGDTIGEKTYFSPHRIVAWNDTLVGYAYPEPFINETKTINIILYNGTLVEMKNNNWNMISIPRIQSNTNLDIVLQSIEGRYKSVQWYDASDINDHWKHYCNSKPSYMNDLKKLNHTMGLWIDINDPQGTTLVIYGDKLTLNQTIPLSLGWNFVGFPSGSNKLVNDSLNGIFYGNDVDAIWTFNSTTQEWIELGPSDYFEVGHGYWIHSKIEEIWNIPV